MPSFYNDNSQTDTNPLGYDAAARRFAAYDPNDPLSIVAGFFLNFDATDAATGEVIEDGKDRIFGDLGNDWIVGGTGKDRLFGGLGNDVLNLDDDLTTHGGANDQPDAMSLAVPDLAFGGAGAGHSCGEHRW